MPSGWAVRFVGSAASWAEKRATKRGREGNYHIGTEAGSVKRG